jgi:hypothetical protein
MPIGRQMDGVSCGPILMVDIDPHGRLDLLPNTR